MSQPSQTEAQPQNASQAYASRFYYPNLVSIPKPMSELLENYSQIPPEDQIAHVLNLRNKAYQAYAYPCLGRFRFTSLDLSSYGPYHSYILPKLTQPSTNPDTGPFFLDLGTCLGQDIRKLIHDGVPPTRVYGSDIIPSFIDNGYELFRDEAKIPRDHFLVPGDVFAQPDDQTDQLRRLDGKVDVLGVTAVFHLFSLEEQQRLVNRCLRLAKKDTGGSVLILGAQAGNLKAVEAANRRGGKAFRHDDGSWRALWEGVISDPNGQWKDVVKNLTVKSSLDVWRDDNGPGVAKADGKDDFAALSKVIGKAEEGFRWQTWEVWLEF